MTLICFFSGSSPPRYMDEAIEHCRARLLSCHDKYMGVARKWLRLAHTHGQSKKREIMLDSGAFSAWAMGAEVTLDEVMRSYGEIINAYDSHYKDIWLINLDKIPGRKGVDPTEEEIQEAFRISDQNYEQLVKEFGDRVLPVFHQGESTSRLYEILAQNENYICVSPRNDLHESLRREWAQYVHQYCKGVGTHGLATTGRGMMQAATWRSVDSATWIQVAGWGQIILDLGDKFQIRHVSEDSSLRRNYKQHLDHLPERAKDHVVQIIEDCGFTYEQAQTDHSARSIINLIQLTSFIDKIVPYDGTIQGGLFDA